MRAVSLIPIYVALQIVAHASNMSEEMEQKWDVNDELEVGLVPMVDVIMDPNINMNSSADRKDTEEPIDPSWDIKLAVRDVGYYLRAYKFSDFDRRYYHSIDDAPSRLYEEFPKPPLRSLHWEVDKNCDISFLQCLKYLERVIKETTLRREDDTVYVIKENNWTLTNNSAQIKLVQNECQEAKNRENQTLVPFEGPFDRFKWCTTASYYMCWFTMLSKPELMFFEEDCDNFANCLDEYGVSNKDPRADDNTPFACATYSFCPDPCCSIKHISNMTDCTKSPTNPCIHVEEGDQTCDFKFSENRDFYTLISNQLNVTCHCKDEGYEWSSRFGLCVDIDECSKGLHNCSLDTGQTCINLPGSFDCMCQMGLIYDQKTENCDMSPIFKEVFFEYTAVVTDTTENILDTIVHALTRSSVSRNYPCIVCFFIISVLCSLFDQLNNIFQFE